MFDGMLNWLILHTVDKYLDSTALHPLSCSHTNNKADITRISPEKAQFIVSDLIEKAEMKSTLSWLTDQDKAWLFFEAF